MRWLGNVIQHGRRRRQDMVDCDGVLASADTAKEIEGGSAGWRGSRICIGGLFRDFRIRLGLQCQQLGKRNVRAVVPTAVRDFDREFAVASRLTSRVRFKAPAAPVPVDDVGFVLGPNTTILRMCVSLPLRWFARMHTCSSHTRIPSCSPSSSDPPSSPSPRSGRSRHHPPRRAPRPPPP